VTPREVLLAAGLRTLVIWVSVGVAFALILGRGKRRIARMLRRRRRTRLGCAVVAALAIGLLFAHVLWPLATLVGVLATTYATVTWPPASVPRVLIATLAIGLVAVAYEADRLSYYVERACVSGKDPTETPCGLLVGQRDTGFYLGVTERPGVADLLFMPTSRVVRARSHKELSRVPEPAARDRRKSIVDRIVHLRVR
jgi:hypothetical protein